MKLLFPTTLVLTMLCILGCDQEPYSSDPPWDGHPAEATGYVDYGSASFQNASEEVQQDAIIYNSLKDMGYSDSEARDAVLNTID